MEFWSTGVLERWKWHLHVVRSMELGTGPNCVFRFFRRHPCVGSACLSTLQHSRTPTLHGMTVDLMLGA
jgi:hypothetical protein